VTMGKLQLLLAEGYAPYKVVGGGMEVLCMHETLATAQASSRWSAAAHCWQGKG
jgi:hypothetical protein